MNLWYFSWLSNIRAVYFNLCLLYLQDASRLVDLCRQSIVFDDAADISTCLHNISTDPDVKIVRVKNRLDPAYNAAVSAGYRDVVLNLKICNEKTVDLGVNEHVCEVQLVHRLFAELKVLVLSSHLFFTFCVVVGEHHIITTYKLTIFGLIQWLIIFKKIHTIFITPYLEILKCCESHLLRSCLHLLCVSPAKVIALKLTEISDYPLLAER